MLITKIRIGHSKLSHLYLLKRNQSTICRKYNIQTIISSISTISSFLILIIIKLEGNWFQLIIHTFPLFRHSSEILRKSRFLPNYNNSINFCKSLIIYDIDATLSLLIKKKKLFRNLLIYLSFIY